MTNTEQAISLPFIIGPTGVIETTTDQSKIWADRVLSVIGTAVGERAQRYYFGSEVHFEQFETVSKAIDGLPEKISTAFNRYLPLLSFNKLDTLYDQNTGLLDVTVFYTLPDNSLNSAKIGTVQIVGNQPPKEL